MKAKPIDINTDLKMPADEFDRIMRKAMQVSPEAIPKREKFARTPKIKRRDGK